MENYRCSLKHFKMKLNYLAIPLLGVCTKELKSLSGRDIFSPIIIASRRITGANQSFSAKNFNYHYVEAMGIKMVPEDTEDSGDWENVDYENAGLPF